VLDSSHSQTSYLSINMQLQSYALGMLYFHAELETTL
jgi:hypothetical protein